MKPTALLVNTSRGPTVDTPAPLAALRERRIAGAALDVYDAEPLPVDDPLHTTPGLLATPHIGYVTRDPYTTFYRDAVKDIAAFLNGTPVRVLAALHTRRPNHTPSTQRSPQTAPSPEK
jgi:phosphoglycerate dehydrogenase-like enzyme